MNWLALTQKEIEDLINSMLGKSDELEKPHVAKARLRVYDFKRPDKFSKDHIRGAQVLFDDYARQLTSFFSGLYRLTTHVNVLSVDQMTFEEFARGLPNPCSVAIIEWKSLPSNVILNISPKIALPMVDRLCGGPGNVSVVSRSLTEIETAILKRVAQTMVDILKDTLREFNIDKRDLQATSLEVNPLFIQQAMAPNDIVLSVVLSMKFGNQEGTVEFCLPYILLEPILPVLSAQRWFSKRSETNEQKDEASIVEALENVEVPISCRLGETTLTMEEVLSLKPGDVIELDLRIRDLATVYILGKPKFKAKVGRIGSSLACEIVRQCEENGEEV